MDGRAADIGEWWRDQAHNYEGLCVVLAHDDDGVFVRDAREDPRIATLALRAGDVVMRLPRGVNFPTSDAEEKRIQLRTAELRELLARADADYKALAERTEGYIRELDQLRSDNQRLEKLDELSAKVLAEKNAEIAKLSRELDEQTEDYNRLSEELDAAREEALGNAPAPEDERTPTEEGDPPEPTKGKGRRK